MAEKTCGECGWFHEFDDPSAYPDEFDGWCGAEPPQLLHGPDRAYSPYVAKDHPFCHFFPGEKPCDAS